MKSNQKIWLKVFSTLLVAFTIFMFIAYRLFPDSREPAPLDTKTIIGLSVVGIGFIGLLLAWKWEFTGSIISLVAFVVSAVFFPMILLPTLLYIWPVTAVVFILLEIKNRKTEDQNM